VTVYRNLHGCYAIPGGDGGSRGGKRLHLVAIDQDRATGEELNFYVAQPPVFLLIGLAKLAEQATCCKPVEPSTDVDKQSEAVQFLWHDHLKPPSWDHTRLFTPEGPKATQSIFRPFPVFSAVRFDGFEQLT
jgi:hypothetical protein